MYESLHGLIQSWSWFEIYTLLLDLDQYPDETDLVGFIIVGIPVFTPDILFEYWCLVDYQT